MRSQPFRTALVARALEQVDGSEAGLTSAEASTRLKRWGPNELAPPRRFEAVREIVRYLANPLVLILLVASGVSAAFGQVVSSAVIALMVVLSIVLNFTQAYRSQLAARRLRERVRQVATVVRDGVLRDLPAREVLPGDVIHLSAGDLVPADGLQLAAKDHFLKEAPLTGESLPREKHASAGGASGNGVGDAATAVFCGTSVVSGVGVAVVVHTGSSTEFGHVAAQLSARPADIEFERGIRRFGFLILEVVIFLVLFVFLVNVLLRRNPLESFLFAVALAVGLSPELLPMIVSVTLASGAFRMSKKKVIVKRLAAMENLGSMDILCCDKTGTLTLGEITVDRHVNLRGENDEVVIRLAALNSAYQTGLRSPMDEAILRHEHPDVARYVRVDEIPFDFERRRVSVVVEEGGRRLLITKGAPESVLHICVDMELDGTIGPFDAAAREGAERLFRSLSADGYRVLGVAYRPVGRQAAYTVDDNELVTERICAQVGLAPGAIVLGGEIDRMSDPALAAIAERTTVFARVSPIQKSRIVQALRSRGRVVGCVGDGINDAPAL